MSDSKVGTRVPEVRIILHRTGKCRDGNAYEAVVPGMGFTGCIVTARNARMAKKVVGEFVFNELIGAGVLTE